MCQQKICLETSSLIPLIVSTPYSIRVSKYICENPLYKYHIFKDSIREAKNTKFLQINSYQGIKSEKSHTNYVLSVLSNINEKFTSQNLQHNFARGCMMFIMDVLDNISTDEKSYANFCNEVYNELEKKIKKILDLLEENNLNLNINQIAHYWQIDSSLKKFNICIEVMDDEESPSKSNKDRDIYHFKQFYDSKFDLLLVCDSGFKKQISDLKKYEESDIKKIIHFNKI